MNEAPKKRSKGERTVAQMIAERQHRRVEAMERRYDTEPAVRR